MPAVDESIHNALNDFNQAACYGPEKQAANIRCRIETATDPVYRDALFALLAAHSVETVSLVPGTFYNELKKVEERSSNVSAMLVLVHIAHSVLTGWRKGDFVTALKHVDMAAQHVWRCNSLARELDLKVSIARGFALAYRHDFGPSLETFDSIIQNAPDENFLSHLCRAGQGYVHLLMQGVGEGGMETLIKAQRLLEPAGAWMERNGYTSFAEHVTLYRGIVRLRAGGNHCSTVRELLEPLCEETVLYRPARVFAPLAIALAERQNGASEHEVQTWLEKHSKAQMDEYGEKRIHYHRIPELFLLHVDAEILPSGSMNLEEKKSVLRSGVESYKRVLKELSVQRGGVRGFYVSSCSLARAVNRSFERIVDLYLAKGTALDDFPRALFALDKSRYPLARHYDPEDRVNGTEDFVAFFEKHPEHAFLALRQNHNGKKTVVCAMHGASNRKVFEQYDADPASAASGVLRGFAVPPGTLYVLAGSREIGYDIQAVADRVFNQNVQVRTVTSLELFVARGTPSVCAARSVHLHLPGQYSNRMNFNTPVLKEKIEKTFERVEMSNGMITDKVLWLNNYPMIIVGHGTEQDDEPAIDFGTGVLKLNAINWPSLDFFKGRGLLFLSCQAAKTSGADTVLNVPFAFLNAGADFALASLHDVRENEFGDAVDLFAKLVRGEPVHPGPWWRILV